MLMTTFVFGGLLNKRSIRSPKLGQSQIQTTETRKALTKISNPIFDPGIFENDMIITYLLSKKRFTNAYPLNYCSKCILIKLQGQKLKSFRVFSQLSRCRCRAQILALHVENQRLKERNRRSPAEQKRNKIQLFWVVASQPYHCCC